MEENPSGDIWPTLESGRRGLRRKRTQDAQVCPRHVEMEMQLLYTDGEEIRILPRNPGCNLPGDRPLEYFDKFRRSCI